MNDAYFLLQEIIKNPKEDSLRRMYADAIHGEDEDRAKFINVQIELAGTPEVFGVGNPIYQDVRSELFGNVVPIEKVVVGYTGGVRRNARYDELRKLERDLTQLRLEVVRRDWFGLPS